MDSTTASWLSAGDGAIVELANNGFAAMKDQDWDIRNEGRAWGDEAMERYMLTPEKFEMVGGKLLWNDEMRVQLLGLLLENTGADRAVQLGNPDVWRAAVAKLG